MIKKEEIMSMARDLSFSPNTIEKVVNKPKVRQVYHSYSDQPEESIYIHSYSSKEIFAETVLLDSYIKLELNSSRIK